MNNYFFKIAPRRGRHNGLGASCSAKIRGLTFFLCFLITCLAANAQTVIDIETARFLGLTNSQEIARADASIRTAVLNERTQFFNLLPSISASYSASMNFLQNNQFVNPFDTFSARIGLSIGYSLPTGGNDFVTRAISNIRIDIARINSLSTYYEVLESIDNAYYTVLRAAAALQSAESLLEAANLALTVAEVRYNNGMMNRIQYLEAQAEVISSENTRNQNQRDLTLSMITLRDLIGVQGEIILEPVNFSAYDDILSRLAGISAEETDALYETLWSILLANNPSLKTAALNSQIAEMNYSNFFRGYAPTLSVNLNFGDILSYSAASGFSGPSVRAGITLSGTIPIEFWRESIKIENQERERDNSLDAFSAALKNSQNALLRNLYNLLSQASAVLTSRRMLEIEENRYAGTLERYMLSQSSISDLNSAAQRTANYQNTLNNANYTFLQRLSTLRTSCALDDEEQLINILLGDITAEQ